MRPARLAALLAAVVPGHRVRARWRQVLPGTHATGSPWRWADQLRSRVGAAGQPSQLALAATLGAGCGLALNGLMAGLVLAEYSAMAAWLLRRGLARRTQQRSRRFAVDAVAALAAELRAGLPVSTALTASAPALWGPTVAGQGPAGAAGVARRVAESIEVAESSGAPLADVLDRLDAHLRAVDRTNTAASAQAAGVRASAALLAAMPVAGVGLGYLISADPLRVLLHTTFGAACLGGASVLQLAGVAWAVRLSRVEVAV